MATVNSIAVALMDEFGEDSSNATLVTTYERWVDEVYQEIGSQTRYVFLQGSEPLSTVASQASYTLDVEASSVQVIRRTDDDYELDYMSIEDQVARGYDLEETGEPELYRYDGLTDDAGDQKVTIILHPIPDAVYPLEVHWHRQVKSLGTSDHVPLPFEFLHVLKAGVRANHYALEEDFENAGYWDRRFRLNLGTMISKYQVPGGTNFRMQPTDVTPTTRMPPVRLPPSDFSNRYW